MAGPENRGRYWWLAWRCLWSPQGSRAPRTPIRWLCLRSFCYLASCDGRPLRPQQLDQMGQLLELGVFLNRCLDGKSSFSAARYRRLRRGLPRETLRDYLRALKAAEKNRPRSGDWNDVRGYRRAVLDLSLLALFRLAKLPVRGVLSPLVALVQLVDDVMDHSVDRALGLPTLITVQGPSPEQQAKELWQELRQHSLPQDSPIVGLGFLVYLLARVAARARLRT